MLKTCIIVFFFFFFNQDVGETVDMVEFARLENELPNHSEPPTEVVLKGEEYKVSVSGDERLQHTDSLEP